jgi:hypothetical protein
MSLLASDSTLVPVRPPKGPTVIRVSYSSLGTFSSCARKFELDKLYPRVERVGEDWYAADVGKALHTGYQNYLTHQSEEAAIWAFMTEFPYELEYQQTNDYRSFNAALNTLEEMLRFMPINEYRLFGSRDSASSRAIGSPMGLCSSSPDSPTPSCRI